MKIGIFFPLSRAQSSGNQVTASRWSNILRELGHEVRLNHEYHGEAYDLAVCLHALKTADIAAEIRKKHPQALRLVALTGTDIRANETTRLAALQRLQYADAILCLNAKTIRDLPQELRSKTYHIPQSALSVRTTQDKVSEDFTVVVAGHLREEKDPFRTALASRLLPADSRITIRHFGGALDPALADEARTESKSNPRYSWFAEVPHGVMLQEIAAADLIVQSSRVDEAPSLLSEAIVAGRPLLISSIPGLTGVLGDSYQGVFPVEDTDSLAALLLKAEQNPDWLEALTRDIRSLQKSLQPQAEKQAWISVLDSLTSD